LSGAIAVFLHRRLCVRFAKICTSGGFISRARLLHPPAVCFGCGARGVAALMDYRAGLRGRAVNFSFTLNNFKTHSPIVALFSQGELFWASFPEFDLKSGLDRNEDY
jgi:hypothetical protein